MTFAGDPTASEIGRNIFSKIEPAPIVNNHNCYIRHNKNSPWKPNTLLIVIGPNDTGKPSSTFCHDHE